MDFSAIKGMVKYFRLPEETRKVAFYAENRYDWKHLGPLVQTLIATHDQQVCYLTSDLSDPVFSLSNSRLVPIYVGSGAVRTILFRFLKSKILVLTMPDLDCFHLKRSVEPVRYIYVFHSIVSTHMIYRPAAFDFYETVFCVGPHHVREIQKREALFGLRPKQLVQYGYGYLDQLNQEKSRSPIQAPDPTRVLIAPSWGPNCITARCGIQIIEVLVNAGYTVIFRPHPMSARSEPGAFGAIVEKYSNHPSVMIDLEPSSERSFEASFILLTDWSGSALEFAFSTLRPTIFVDFPKKVNNPDYELLELSPLEVTIREKIGQVIKMDDVARIPDWIEEARFASRAIEAKIEAIHRETVFNVGKSAGMGASSIIQILKELQ